MSSDFKYYFGYFPYFIQCGCKAHNKTAINHLTRFGRSVSKKRYTYPVDIEHVLSKHMLNRP